jgi:phage shock protein A
MSILDRVRRLTSANVNDLLDRFDKPETALKQKIRELENTISEAKESAAGFAASLRKLEKEQEQKKRLKAEWQHKAESAINNGNEDLARRALDERIKAEERIKTLEPSIENNRKTYQKLRENLGTLTEQLQTARMKLSELKSRKQAATARKSFGKQMDRSASTGATESDFDKFENEVVQTEVEAEIEDEVRGDLDEVTVSDKHSRELEVESELESLKKKAGGSKSE